MGILNETYRLEQVGCTNIERYTLVSNYGYRFSKGGIEYDLRYWENCYGVYGGGWRVDSMKGSCGSPSFGDDFNGAVEWIKNNLPQEAAGEPPIVEYPCTTCERTQTCSYKECSAFRSWFSQEWKDIQEAARRIKEKKIRRIKW